jgi:hypothetical protein
MCDHPLRTSLSALEEMVWMTTLLPDEPFRKWWNAFEACLAVEADQNAP